jgi:hypothetical protein
MSGMIDLSGGAAAARGPTAGAPQSYELLDSDTDEDEAASAAAPSVPSAAAAASARARREAEIRAGRYASQASGIAADGGWGAPAGPAAGARESRLLSGDGRRPAARGGSASLPAARSGASLGGASSAAAAAPAAPAAAADAAAAADPEDVDECCPERCTKCLLCASARTCHGAQPCLCEKLDGSQGQSEEERQRHRQWKQQQSQREQELLHRAMEESAKEAQRAPPPPAEQDFDAQMAEALRLSMEDAKLQEIGDGPPAPAAAAAARPARPSGTKRPHSAGTEGRRLSKNARPSKNAPAAAASAAQPRTSAGGGFADHRRAAAEAAEARSAVQEVAALKQQLAEKAQEVAALRRLAAAPSPDSAPGSAPGSPATVTVAASPSREYRQRFARERAQFEQRQAELEREVSQLKSRKLSDPKEAAVEHTALAPATDLGKDFGAKAEAYHHTLHMQRKLWELSAKKDKKGVTFSVRRDPAHFLKDSCSKIAKLSKRQLMASPIWVKFEGEEGVDEGGVTREFWSMIGETLSPGSSSSGGSAATAAASAGTVRGGRGGLALFERLSDEPGAAFLPAASATDKESLELFYGLGILISRMLLDSAAPLDIAKASASSARPLESNFGLLCLRYFIWRDEREDLHLLSSSDDGDAGRSSIDRRGSSGGGGTDGVSVSDLGMSDVRVCHASGPGEGPVRGYPDALLSLVRDGHGAPGLASGMAGLQNQSLGAGTDTTVGELGLVEEDDSSESAKRVSALRLCESEPMTKEAAIIAILHHKLLGSRRKQLESLRSGFVYAGMDWWKILRMFSDGELRELLWQPAVVDVEAVISLLHFRSFEPCHRTPMWLASLLRDETNDFVGSFLRWCTGTAAISPGSTSTRSTGGASRLSSSFGAGAAAAAAEVEAEAEAEAAAITVQWEPEYETGGRTRCRFPTASTCARTVTLPEYETEAFLREQLNRAVLERVFRSQ